MDENKVTEEIKTTDEIKATEEVKEEATKVVETAVDDEKWDAAGNSELKTIAEILKDIKVDEHTEMKFAKRQSVTSLILSVLCLLIVGCVAVAIVMVIPKVNKLLKTADDTIKQASMIMEDAQTAVDNLNQITTDLSQVKIDEIVTNVNNLVTDSQESIGQAMQQLNKVDFDGLNSAINDLQSVIEPLAKLFGR